MNDLILVTEADMSLLSLLGAHAPLRRELDRAIVVSSVAMPPDVATMNSKLRYIDETAGEERTVWLVYPGQADDFAGRISVLAPAGTALLGLSEGQKIAWDFPDGSLRRLRLLQVVHQPERVSNSPPRGAS